VKIEISEQAFKRLQRHAVPLLETVEDVIVKLLDAYEGKRVRETVPRNLLDDLLPPHMRPKRRVAGFAGDLWELVILKLPERFSLADVYKNIHVIGKKRPHVKELEAAARASLQTLRDAGYVEFLDNRGEYRRVSSDTGEARP
jgi:hypothetical protein